MLAIPVETSCLTLVTRIETLPGHAAPKLQYLGKLKKRTYGIARMDMAVFDAALLEENR